MYVCRRPNSLLIECVCGNTCFFISRVLIGLDGIPPPTSRVRPSHHCHCVHICPLKHKHQWVGVELTPCNASLLLLPPTRNVSFLKQVTHIEWKAFTELPHRSPQAYIADGLASPQNTQSVPVTAWQLSAVWVTVSVYLNWRYIKQHDIQAGTNSMGVGIATGYGLDDRGVGVRIPVGSRIFSSPRRPDRPWGPPNHLSNGYRELFLRG
jgi:hypothetical protein